MDAWQMSGVRPNLRTSLIVDPPDGRIPPLTPEAQKRRPRLPRPHEARGADVTTPGLYTRCITGNGGPPRIPGRRDRRVADRADARIRRDRSPSRTTTFGSFPWTGVPHLPKTRRPVAGRCARPLGGLDARRGDDQFQRQRNWRGSNEGMHLVERFTLVGPKTLRYQFTVTDPTTWTRPWSIDSLLPKIDPPIYEFACHEHELWLDQLGHRHADPGKRGGTKRSNRATRA